jgi:dTDP-glucose 4,6-dehydratase
LQPVNLGNPEEVTIIDFAQELIDAVGSRSPIKFLPLPTDDPQRRKPDVLKAMTMLGWRPKVTRRDGIRRVLPYFEKQVRLRTAIAV